jgi:hypothetical protein
VDCANHHSILIPTEKFGKTCEATAKSLPPQLRFIYGSPRFSGYHVREDSGGSAEQGLLELFSTVLRVSILDAYGV